MKIGIMGAGALGSLIGGYFFQAGEDVILVGRRWNIDPIIKNGLKFIPLNSDKIINLKIKATIEPSDCDIQDLVILTVKAFDTEKALQDAEPMIEKGHTRILCMQNGYGTEKIAVKLYGNKNILRGITSNGALIIEPGCVKHTGYGDTFIGVLDKSTKYEDILDIFNSTVLKAEFVENIEEKIWGKVLVNAAINPFGAITRLRNGQLLENNKIVECMKSVVIEGVNVLNSIGLKLNMEDSIQNAIKVAKLTANNKNSMLQDIEKGRRTEIDFINGAISRLGKKNGIPTPMNDLLVALIKGIEYNLKN